MCTPTFIVALFTIAKIFHQPRCLLVDELINEMWDICTIVLSHDNGQNSVICNNMDGTEYYNVQSYLLVSMNGQQTFSINGQ